jgi:alpha-D-ribose 1-methylphosphonate 5-triphosphate synthase subunit PhnH
MWTQPTRTPSATTNSPVPTYLHEGNRPPADEPSPPPVNPDVFIVAWDALRFPGMWFEIPGARPTVPGLYPASAALCQGLATAGRSLWIDQAERSPLHQWCRYSTAACLTRTPGKADFTLITVPSDMPSLYRLNIGDGADPATATTLLIQLPALEPGSDMLWHPANPGALPQKFLEGIAPHFWQERIELQEMLPWGIDIFFIHESSFFSMPRTMRVTATSPA